MSIYKIGVGKADITDHTPKLQLQGFADSRQKSIGIRHAIFSRAFVIQEDKPNGTKLAIVIAEIWSCTKHLKNEVLRLLRTKPGGQDYSEENLHIAGTHTHSAPGGYAGYKLFSQPIDLTDKKERQKAKNTTKKIVQGIVKSILQADKKLKPGKIFLSKGSVQNCGQQRSEKAYENNPDRLKNKYTSKTDQESLLLKMVHISGNKEIPVGVLNWYAIHPTDIGQYNTKISGDNKGEASRLFEKFAHQKIGSAKFVAAFANANCGDVSGNVGIDMTRPDSAKNYLKNMKRHGKLQFQEAKRLFNTPGTELQGSVNLWFRNIQLANTRIKNSNERTWPYALGISFAAGSEEDGASVYELCGTLSTVKKTQSTEGLRIGDLSKSQKRFFGEMKLGMHIALSAVLPRKLKKEEIDGHRPKPIGFTGKNREEIVPAWLPFQVFKIGNFALLGIPAEISTMAGRVLREEILAQYSNLKVNALALGTYANDYSQYITTKKEYDMQHYEGASTPYGPYTLQAYIQEFSALPYPEDQYVDCIDNSSREVKFYVQFVNASGNIQKANTRKPVDYFRFSIPHDATIVQVRASTKTKSSGWSFTGWQPINLTGSATAQRIEFNGRKIEYSGEIENKKIECINASTYLGDVFIVCKFKTASGASMRRVSPPNVQYYHEFDVPWNASDFEVHVEYNKKKNNSNTQRFQFGSHQKIRLEFLDGILYSRGIVSEW